MASPRFKKTYDLDYKWHDVNERMKALNISFESQVEFKRNKNGQPIHNLAWCSRDDPTFIRINGIFRQRLDQLTKYDIAERSSIIAMIAVLICHELGHLMLRWRGLSHYYSPEKYNCGWTEPEAGYFLEKALFGSTIHIRVPRDRGNQWTSSMPIMGNINYCSICTFLKQYFFKAWLLEETR